MDTSVKTPRETSEQFFDMVENETDQLEPFIQGLSEKKNLPENMVRAELFKFTDYWCELNQAGTKKRWENEKTFEVERRLRRWFMNISSASAFKPKSNTAFIL